MKIHSSWPTAIVLSLIMLTSFVGCEIETSGNGALDGRWHLVSVDTLSTSGTRDMSEDLVFWAFQVKLLQLEDHTYGASTLLMRFSRGEGQLTLNEPYFSDRENGDSPVTDPASLSIYGINELEETFTVEKLTGSRMILNNGTLRLSFKKQ